MRTVSPKLSGTNALNAIFSVACLLFILGCVCPKDFGKDEGNSETVARETQGGSKDSSAEADASKKDKGDFIVQYATVSNVKYEDLDREIKQSKVLEKAAGDLNRALVLPRDIYLRSSDCDGVINAFYDPQENGITICYELMEHFFGVFRRAGYSTEESSKKMSDAITWVFLHEVGHALIENYRLAIAGGEEDAADRLSSYVNLKELGDDGASAVLAGGEAFALMSKNRRPDAREMADEHLLGEQRFFNSLCLLFGSDPDKYAGIVTKGFLPKERAVRCPSEFQRNQEAWDTLLGPWRK
jgi:hypothetical protein